MKRSVAIAVLVLALGVLAGCGDGSTPRVHDATIPANLTLDEVYARMEQALAGGKGKVMHVTVTMTDVQSSMQTPEGAEDLDFADYADQVWIDAATGVARVETRWRVAPDPQDHVERALVRHDVAVRVDPDGRSNDVDPLTCRGSDSPFLAQLMRCHNYLEESTSTVAAGEYAGRAAIVLVTTGTLSDSDGSWPFEHRLYVDPSTYWPVRANRSETIGDQRETEMLIEQRYDIEFVDRTSLADDFFAPEGIGYVVPDPTAGFVPEVDGMRVYWLGRKFDGVAGTPALVLLRGGARDRPPGLPPGYRFTATYEQEGGRRNYPVLDLQEFPPDAWRQLNPDSGGHFWNAPGVTREDVSIPGGRAVLFRVPASYERYVAHVYFDTTVILVGDADQPSPYANRDAILAVIRGLRPFE